MSKNIETLRVCTKCHSQFPIQEFYNLTYNPKNRPFGPNIRCRTCNNYNKNKNNNKNINKNNKKRKIIDLTGDDDEEEEEDKEEEEEEEEDEEEEEEEENDQVDDNHDHRLHLIHKHIYPDKYFRRKINKYGTQKFLVLFQGDPEPEWVNINKIHPSLQIYYSQLPFNQQN